MSKARPGLRHAYRTPLLIGIASLIGLVSALVGDGVFDMISWLALGALVAIIAVMLRRKG